MAKWIPPQVRIEKKEEAKSIWLKLLVDTAELLKPEEGTLIVSNIKTDLAGNYLYGSDNQAWFYRAGMTDKQSYDLAVKMSLLDGPNGTQLVRFGYCRENRVKSPGLLKLTPESLLALMKEVSDQAFKEFQTKRVIFERKQVEQTETAANQKLGSEVMGFDITRRGIEVPSNDPAKPFRTIHAWKDGTGQLLFNVQMETNIDADTFKKVLAVLAEQKS